MSAPTGAISRPGQWIENENVCATPQEFIAKLGHVLASAEIKSAVMAVLVRSQEAAEQRPPSPTPPPNKVRQTKPASQRPTNAKGAVGKISGDNSWSRTFTQRTSFERPVLFWVALFVRWHFSSSANVDRGRSAPCKCLRGLSHNGHRDQGQRDISPFAVFALVQHNSRHFTHQNVFRTAHLMRASVVDANREGAGWHD